MKRKLYSPEIFKPLFFLLLFARVFETNAQVSVDHSIQLTGTGANARVTGIDSVGGSEDAVSVKTLQNGSFIYAVATGNSNNFNITISPPVSGYQAGMMFNFISNQTISGPTTLNVNSLGAIPIMKYFNQAFTGCEIQNGQIVTVVYDGTNFQITSVFGLYALTPGTISGPDTVCPNVTGLVYSITPVSGATGYNWTVPAGATITANTGTSITANFGANPAGNITVSATNGCPTSAPSALMTLAATLPTVLSTTAAAAINVSTAASGGDVSSDGGAPVTAYGVCWSTSPNPVLGAGNYTTDGTGVGTFTSSITGLAGGTTYYVSAYATNCVGTAYGPQISFTTYVAIGSQYQGGIVAYILQPGDAGYNANVQHGLIAATSDQETTSLGIAWWNGTYTTTNATGTAIGTGASNTALIIANQGPGTYAATLCTGYTGGGFNDWYLPSIDELNELYLNIGPGNALGLGNVGGFDTNGTPAWWSSTEYNVYYAWYQLFYDGAQVSDYKYQTTYVRAVRSF